MAGQDEGKGNGEPWIVLEGDRDIIERVIKALKDVYDPEIPVNVYDLGLIYEIRVKKDEKGKPVIYVAMTLTAVGCPVSAAIAAYAEEAIREAVPEASDVIIDVVFDPPWTPDRVTPEGREMLKSLFGYDVVEEWKRRMEEMQQQQA